MSLALLRQTIDGFLHDLGIEEAAIAFQDIDNIEQQLRIIKVKYRVSAINPLSSIPWCTVLPFFLIYSDYHPMSLRACRGTL